MFNRCRGTKASSLTEYAIVLGIILTVLITMGTYIKRGTQGKIKDMTDYFISNEQVSDDSPGVNRIGDTTSTYDPTGYIKYGTLVGDSSIIYSHDTAKINVVSNIEDRGTNP